MRVKYHNYRLTPECEIFWYEEVASEYVCHVGQKGITAVQSQLLHITVHCKTCCHLMPSAVILNEYYMKQTE